MNLVLIIIALLVMMYLLNANKQEGYSSVTGHNTESRGNLDDYYLWRAYGHDVYNHCNLRKYPYNYQPKEHPMRYTHYNPYFYQYGYGHL